MPMACRTSATLSLLGLPGKDRSSGSRRATAEAAERDTHPPAQGMSVGRHVLGRSWATKSPPTVRSMTFKEHSQIGKTPARYQ